MHIAIIMTAFAECCLGDTSASAQLSVLTTQKSPKLTVTISFLFRFHKKCAILESKSVYVWVWRGGICAVDECRCEFVRRS